MTWAYMNGSSGCLPDNLVGGFESHKEAVESALDTFYDLPEDERVAMAIELERAGIHYFSAPAEAGADYVQVVEEEGGIDTD